MTPTSLRSMLNDLFTRWGVQEVNLPYLTTLILFFITLLASGIIYFLTRYVLLRVIKKIIHSTSNTWDDIFLTNKVFHPLAYLAPAAVIGTSTPFVFKDFPAMVPYVEDLVTIIVIFSVMLVITAILNAVETIISQFEVYKDKPIASFIQLGKILNYLISGLLILSVLMAANDMIRVGDWVEMKDYGADGDVMNINLTTVKIRNFDNTITTVPTYAFISNSFKNWRGMSETGARRIKRAVVLKQSRIRYADAAFIEKIRQLDVMKDYVATMTFPDPASIKGPSDTRYTNIGLFRNYLQAYLKQHRKLNHNFTTMVRQLAPDEKGLPLEIYCFANTIKWIEYENIQSDIMDHVLAAAAYFDLEIAQIPTSGDVTELKSILPVRE
jgi:miniconductance mechanosensitive channel